MWNIPNQLTLLRILLIPVLVGMFYAPYLWARPASALVFVAAAVTDWFDGYLARKWGQVSPFGAFLDPVADKLIVAAALILIVQSDPQPMLAVGAIVIIGREITISALREWMSKLGDRSRVAVSAVGKIKTTAQMVAISAILYQQPIAGMDVYQIGVYLLYVAVLLTLWSMVSYLRAAWPELKH